MIHVSLFKKQINTFPARAVQKLMSHDVKITGAVLMNGCGAGLQNQLVLLRSFPENNWKLTVKEM